jgi:hypothetical protein
VVDETEIQSVAADADTGMAERVGAHDTTDAAKAQNRHIAGAAAEIRDQNGRVRFQALSVVKGGSDRLEHVMLPRRRQRRVEGSAIPPQRQGLVGACAGKFQRPADDDVGVAVAWVQAGMAEQRVEKSAEQGFESIGCTENLCR